MNGAEFLHGTQLSFIQLGAGMAVGVHGEQKKYYTLFWGSRAIVFKWSTLAVWTTTQYFPII